MIKYLLAVLLLVVAGCEDQNPLRPSDQDNDSDIGSTNTQLVNVVVVVHNHPDDGNTNVPNRAPVLTSPGGQQSVSGETVLLSLAATDPENDVLTWIAGGLPRSLTLDQLTGVISGTVTVSSADDSPFTVTIAVSDGMLSDSVVFVWTVEPAP